MVKIRNNGKKWQYLLTSSDPHGTAKAPEYSPGPTTRAPLLSIPPVRTDVTPDSSTDDAIVVYSDYVCPFCYLGRQSLEAFREDRDDPLAVEWRPFDLRRHKRGPDGEIDDSVDDGKDEAYFDQVRENVRRLKAEYGAEEMVDLDALQGVDSLNAQVASYYVGETHPEAWPAFDEAVFEALWVDGRDVGDPGVLADLAAEVGLDADEIREAVADEAVRSEVEAAFAEAHQQGITGVPTFAYGEHAARGAVPPEQLERLVDGG